MLNNNQISLIMYYSLILLTTCISVAFVFFHVGKSYPKFIKPTDEDIIKLSINNVKFLQEINPLVKEIYLLFIKKDGYKHFQQGSCDIIITALEIEFWHANDVYSRRFSVVPTALLKQYNVTLKELNDSLTFADKKILDHIAQAIIINNREFISRLFI